MSCDRMGAIKGGKVMKFPKVVYVTRDSNGEPPDDLLAWPSLEKSDDGRVGVYVLQEILEKRQVPEVRKVGKRNWFKP